MQNDKKLMVKRTHNQKIKEENFRCWFVGKYLRKSKFCIHIQETIKTHKTIKRSGSKFA